MTTDQLKQILPHVSDKAINVFLPHLNTFMTKYEIDTPQRIGAFIAEIGEESGNLQYTTEIASGTNYEGRENLGNLYPGDGRKYKGRGLIQITGRKNYRNCSIGMFGDDRLEATPELLSTPQNAVESACWFWHVRGINEVCDHAEDWIKPGAHHYSKFQWITILINGGLNHYDERLANYNRAKQVLNF